MMEVTYITHMGDDLMVANAARVSFAKHTDTFREQDEKLIHFLAKNEHWTPFGHPHVCIRVKAPLFVARQLGRHQVGLVWNEVSRRYVDTKPEFYTPASWRSRAKDKKQGSGPPLDAELQVLIDKITLAGEELAFHQYQSLLDMGVCPEQARMVLPQTTYTEWYWTGSLAAWARIYNLRSQPDAQREVQEIAEEIKKIMKFIFPVSWPALTTSS